MATTGFIFDVKRFSINDGPGIRVTIFFKGCPLSCAWCHNPESVSPRKQKLYTGSKCIGCGECVTACPNHALTLTDEGVVTDKEACDLCGQCADACPTKAMEISGESTTVEALMTIIERERIFMDHSKGGITVSGGEPLLQRPFVTELLDRCGELGIHRTVDTSGMVDPDTLLSVAKRTDLFLYDVKHMDSDLHEKWTGVGNQLILDNLTLLAKNGHAFQIRIPLIKGVNADDDNLTKTAIFLAHLPGPKPAINLLPFHRVAIPKYAKLGETCDLSGMNEPTQEELDHAIALFAEHGLTATVGG